MDTELELWSLRKCRVLDSTQILWRSKAYQVAEKTVEGYKLYKLCVKQKLLKAIKSYFSFEFLVDDSGS